jgi:hypothetical protein
MLTTYEIMDNAIAIAGYANRTFKNNIMLLTNAQIKKIANYFYMEVKEVKKCIKTQQYKDIHNLLCMAGII